MDSLRQLYSEPANGRNKKKNKTARARLTSQRDTVSAQTPFDTQNTSQPAFDSVLNHDNGESNISEGALVDSQDNQTTDDTARKLEVLDSFEAYKQLYCTCKRVSIDHFATFPPDLIEPCILAGSRVGDVVLDPFNGSGTTGSVAIKHHRDYIGIELNPEYIKLSEKRLLQTQPVLFPASCP